MGLLTKTKIIFSLLLIIVFLQLIHLYVFKDEVDIGQVAGLKTQQEKVIVSAFVGKYHFSLFGYSSPGALVSLNGQGIADETYADITGYFEFKNNFSPFLPREACLNARDQFGRISTPVCLPPFPIQYSVVIGPVIVPPTISLDKPNYFIGDEVILTGQTLPDANINLSIFTQPSTFILPNLFPLLSSNFHLIKPVEAFSIPKLTTKSDNKGNFSLALPSSQAQNYRLFTQVDYQDEPSANSLALSLKILPIWMIIIKFFVFIWNLLKSRLLEVVILLEIIALIAHFFRVFLHPYYLSKNKAIVAYKNHLPTIEEDHSLMINRS
ncbi:MAG: hypothetical protein V1803_02335 [Candidatus Roizmanbacteria bacterium]